MNSRQRILKVLNGEIPDRVPVCLFIHDEGNFLTQIYPDLDLKNPLDCKYKLINLERELGLDLLIRLLQGIYPDWIVYGGVNTSEQTENWEVRTEEFRDGKSTIKKFFIRTPEGDLKQEFTISESIDTPGTFWYACTKKPIKTQKDLIIIMKYEPSMDKGFPGMLKDLVTKVKEYMWDDGVTSIWVPGATFNHASLLMDLNDVYSLFLIDYPFYERLMKFCLKRTLPFIKAIANSGVDTISMGGNVPGGFLGIKNYEKYILPFEREYIKNARDFGVKTIYHNCGEIMALAESYKRLETDVVEPFAPPPLGDGNLKEAKKISGGTYVIIGNIDQVNVLKNGSNDEVKRVTRETVEIGKEGGKFILQTADYLEYGTPLDNIKAYVESGIRYGAY